MAKVHINITVDSEIYEFMKARGYNMSQEANEYFKSLMGRDPKKSLGEDWAKLEEKLEKDLAKARAEKAKQEAAQNIEKREMLKEEVIMDLEVLRKVYHEREASLTKKRLFSERLEAFIRKYGYSRGEVMAFIEGKKQVQA